MSLISIFSYFLVRKRKIGVLSVSIVINCFSIFFLTYTISLLNNSTHLSIYFTILSILGFFWIQTLLIFDNKLNVYWNLVLSIFVYGFLYNYSDLSFFNHLKNGGFILFIFSMINIFLVYYKNNLLRNKFKLNYDQENLIKELNKDLSLARKIQIKLLPLNVNYIEPFQIYSKYNPKDEVGGDIFDITKLENNKLRIMLADATGHGIQAALITMLIKSEYESIKGACSNPITVVEVLNYIFFTKYYQLNCIFSLIVVDLDPENEELTYCSAGHPDQILIQKNNLEVLKGTGKIIGVYENSVFNQLTYSFSNTDKLLLFTDGIYEEFNEKEEEYGEERLILYIQNNFHKQMSEFVDGIIESITKFINNKNIHDDITIIGIDYKQPNI
jgi:serine phosphatase RsbU (regulator of sigma subunit)